MKQKCSPILMLLLLLNTVSLFAQKDCFNNVDIKQLGVEFCLPDLEWTVEPEDGLKFIMIHKLIVGAGTNTYTIRTEKNSGKLTSIQSFEKEMSRYQNVPDYKEEIIARGTVKINGKDFYYSKNQTFYKSKGIDKKSYSISYYYCNDAFLYILSHVTDDQNKEKWTEEEALKVWGSFKIISNPESSIFD